MYDGKSEETKEVGVATEEKSKDVKQQYQRQPWLSVRVIIIDEISMVPDWLLDLLDRLAREFKGSNLPFGGIQLILCGDFLQLPQLVQSLLLSLIVGPLWV